MRALRQRGLQRAQWSLQAFSSALLPSWRKLPQPRGSQANARWHNAACGRSPKEPAISPLEWADRDPAATRCDGLAWAAIASQRRVPGAEAKWQQALDTAASLGFDGRRVHWNEFLSRPGSHSSGDSLSRLNPWTRRFQIAGPAESAGLAADAIWFLGADRRILARRRFHAPFAARSRSARSCHAAYNALARLGILVRRHQET